MRWLSFLGAVAVAVAFLPGAVGAPPSRWTISDLGLGEAIAVNEHGQVVGTRAFSLSGSAKPGAWIWERGAFTLVRVDGEAVDVNERGQVAGYVTVFSGETRAFVWQKGAIRYLGSLGGFATYPWDINDAGQVVGSGELPADMPTPTAAAFLWQNGKIRPLAGQGEGAGTGWAAAVNGRGQVVGAADTSAEECGAPRAALWANGRMTNLSPPGAALSEARALNARGQVLVQSLSGDGCNGLRDVRGWLWQSGSFTDLGTLGGASTTVTGLNDRGEVVGSSKTRTGRTHAFVWRHGVMHDLGTLATRAGATYEATAVNDAGQVIGSMNGRSAVVWQGGTITVLGSLGGMQSSASALNDAGQIVGWATTKSGKKHAVLWAPVSGS